MFTKFANKQFDSTSLMQLFWQLDKRSQGFTLIEVIVSIVLLTAFLSVGMSALATASLVKARANSETLATNWIEEDLEAVRSQANLVTYTASQCNPTGTNATTSGFANALKQSLPALSRSGTQTVGGKTYALTRQPIIAAVAPYEVLQLNYTVTVTQLNQRTTLATTYTEVIPNAAFQCSRFQ